MKDAFNEASSDNLAVVILSDENGLSPADEGTYRTLVDELRADTAKVRSTQDFVHIPELEQVTRPARTTRPGSCRSTSAA